MDAFRVKILVEMFACFRNLFAAVGGVSRSALLVLTLLLAANAGAARLEGLYAAVVDRPTGVSAPLQAAFAAALSEVLVKITGLSEAGNAPTRASLFPNPGSIVQQYSMLADGQVRVEFDAEAVRRALDGAGLPMWGADRPLVAIWLAVDAGGGQRFILSDVSAAESANTPQQSSEQLAELRDQLADAADERGLPVVFPLVDAQDLGRVSFADLWGDFREPVQQGSSRYGADVMLIGRTRSLNPAGQGVRWTLVTGDEEAAWQGDIASGPTEAAIFLSRRQATYADSAGALRVVVTGVATLETYGQLLRYFRSLSIVDDVSVARVDGDQVEFSLVARGDAARLSRELDAGRLLTRQQLPGVTTETGRLPDLSYSWSQPP